MKPCFSRQTLSRGIMLRLHQDVNMGMRSTARRYTLTASLCSLPPENSLLYMDARLRSVRFRSASVRASFQRSSMMRPGALTWGARQCVTRSLKRLSS